MPTALPNPLNCRGSAHRGELELGFQIDIVGVPLRGAEVIPALYVYFHLFGSGQNSFLPHVFGVGGSDRTNTLCKIRMIRNP